MTIRDAVVDALQGVVGPGARVLPYQDSFDTLDVPTVMVKQTRIEVLPAAPRGQLRVNYVLTFMYPGIDAATSETDLDQWVPETLADLRVSWLVWTTADKVLAQSTYLAYDVACYALTTLTNTTTPERS